MGVVQAGVALFNDEGAEDLIRRKLQADTRVSIYVSVITGKLYIQ
jgi:hypothetical protein